MEEKESNDQSVAEHLAQSQRLLEEMEGLVQRLRLLIVDQKKLAEMIKKKMATNT